MTRLFVPLVSPASVLALGSGLCLGVSPNTDNTEMDMNACHGYPGQTWIIHQ
jgi:hypothetical protein